MYHKEVNSQDIRNFPKILEERSLEPSFRTPRNKFLRQYHNYSHREMFNLRRTSRTLLSYAQAMTARLFQQLL